MKVVPKICQKLFFIASFGVMMVMLGGCQRFNPDFTALANLEVPSNQVENNKSVSTTISRINWWQAWQDPQLSELIDQALMQNYELQAALAKIEQARVSRGFRRSTRLPQLNAQGTGQQTWLEGDQQRGSGSIGGVLSWEADIFGELRSQERAALFTVQREQARYQLARLLLSGEVAYAYFDAVAAQQRLSLLQEQAGLDEERLELIELRFEQGLGTQVDVLQQQSQLAEVKSTIPPTRIDLSAAENRLDVLLGEVPDGEQRIDSQPKWLMLDQHIPVASVPIELLLKRPDLQAALADIRRLAADVDTAIANRLPQLTHTGSYSYTDGANFSGPVGILSAALVQPLLDWGQRKAQVQESKALVTERVAEFTNLYLEAIREVEQTLYAENQQREYIQRLQGRREILAQTVAKSEARYQEGVDDYLPVLTALQNLRQVERDIITQQKALAEFRVRLYLALGGHSTKGYIQ